VRYAAKKALDTNEICINEIVAGNCPRGQTRGR